MAWRVRVSRGMAWPGKDLAWLGKDSDMDRATQGKGS